MFGVLDMTFPFGFLGYDGIRCHGSIGRVILGLVHFDHTQKIASYVPGANKLYQFLAGEPAVNQQVVEPYSFKDSAFDMGEDTAKDLTLAAGLRKVGVIRYQAVVILAINGVPRIAIRFRSLRLKLYTICRQLMSSLERNL